MEKELYPLYGIVTVLNTPFDRRGCIDIKSLALNVKNALKAGVSGFLVPAMASEVHELSFKEKVLMVESVLEIVGGRVPVFGGVISYDFKSQKKLLKKYLSIGCNEVLIQLNNECENTFKNQFRDLADLNPKTIMLQDLDFNGYGLPDALIIELFGEVENFKCLKVETNPAGVKYSRILELTFGLLNVSGGWAVTQMIEGLRRGVHAFMPTGMHYIYTEIYNEFSYGNDKHAQQLFEKILPVISFSNQHLDISISFFKKLLYQQKIYQSEMVRIQSNNFDQVHTLISDQLIKRVIKIEESIRRSRVINQ